MRKQFFSSEEMYRFDNFTIQSIGIPSPVLMERAALATVDALKQKINEKESILAVAGSGNNGGDAIAVARMLHLHGYNVRILVLTKNNYSDEMKRQLNIAQNIHVPITTELKSSDFTEADLIIDGIFGIGLKREIGGIQKEAILLMNIAKTKHNTRLVAVDIPSGLSAVTGDVFTPAVQADVTYTFGFYKLGMNHEIGKQLCGEVILCDIGYPYKLLLY